MNAFLRSAQILALAAALSLTIVPKVAAVDPLPPELENAPLQEQQAWRTRSGLDSQKQKEQLAQARYAERVEFKQGLIDQLNQEARRRVESVTGPGQVDFLEVDHTNGSIWGLLIVSILTTAFAYFFVRRYILPVLRRI